MDETGKVYNDLTVLSIHHISDRGVINYLCKCKCGNSKITSGGALRLNRTIRCDLCRREAISKRTTTHGHTMGVVYGHRFSRTYTSWYCMLTRVRNPNIKQAKDYSKRNIKVCKRWLKFENFLKDMGERPENTTLDRINNNGNYEKSNCRWADRKTQNNNKRVKS